MSGLSGASAARSKANGEKIAQPDRYVLSRTIEIAEALYARHGENDRHVTVAVAVAEDAHGSSHKLISSNEGNYTRPDVKTLAPPRADEFLVDGFQHAERNIVSFVMSNGGQLKSIGATRGVCAECQNAIGLYKIRAVTIEKEPS
jgi:hypothetical protein